MHWWLASGWVAQVISQLFLFFLKHCNQDTFSNEIAFNFKSFRLLRSLFTFFVVVEISI